MSCSGTVEVLAQEGFDRVLQHESAGSRRSDLPRKPAQLLPPGVSTQLEGRLQLAEGKGVVARLWSGDRHALDPSVLDDITCKDDDFYTDTTNLSTGKVTDGNPATPLHHSVGNPDAGLVAPRPCCDAPGRAIGFAATEPRAEIYTPPSFAGNADSETVSNVTVHSDFAGSRILSICIRAGTIR